MAQFGLALWFAITSGWLQACAPVGMGGQAFTQSSSSGSATGSVSEPGLSASGDSVAPLPDVAHTANADLGRQLTNYFATHRLPLVAANVTTDSSGRRQVMLYGYVATAFGKSDASNKAQQLLNDPGIAIINRVQVAPALLAMDKSSQPQASDANQTNAYVANQASNPYGNSQSYQGQQTQTPGGWLSTLIPLLTMGAGLGFGSGGVGFGGAAYPGYGFPGYGYPYSPYGPYNAYGPMTPYSPYGPFP